MPFEAEAIGGTQQMVDDVPLTARSAGKVYVVGAVPMVATRDRGATDKGPGALSVRGGIYRMACNASIAKGVTVWWDDTNKRVTTTATSNVHFGYTASASYSSNTEIDVVHEPQGVTGAIV
jgi:predicted RecA/RadA family phage recombinase